MSESSNTSRPRYMTEFKIGELMPYELGTKYKDAPWMKDGLPALYDRKITSEDIVWIEQNFSKEDTAFLDQWTKGMRKSGAGKEKVSTPDYYIYEDEGGTFRGKDRLSYKFLDQEPYNVNSQIAGLQKNILKSAALQSGLTNKPSSTGESGSSMYDWFLRKMRQAGSETSSNLGLLNSSNTMGKSTLG